MRWTKYLIPTLKEEPKEAESPSHKLLLRAGFIRQHQSGVYVFLPLGWRVMLKIASIIREEMNKIGAQEMLLPSLTASELWEESGRWEDFGDDMFRLKDRKGRDMALAPTHEEVMTDLARVYLRSYRDLPQIWYQIQTKFRDEPRPRSGILRVREFLMKDSYSFDATWEGLDESYRKHREAYSRIFERCGLKFTIVEASTGLMGGTGSEEFMVLSDSGEDSLVICEKCGYSANMEVARGKPKKTQVKSPFKKKEKVHTPGVKTVEEVSSFLEVDPSLIVKSLIYFKEDETILVLIRGDYEVNEAKLLKVLGYGARLAEPEEVLHKFGIPVGFLGPLGLNVDRIIADETVRGLEGSVVGANEVDYHIGGIDIEEDLRIDEFVDIREVKEGDFCPQCGSPLTIKRAIEIGHIFKLGTKYSESMGAYYTAKDGSRKPIIMGSYGIGLGRIMASAVELYHDDDGIIWPITIAPFEVEVLSLNPKLTNDWAESIYNKLREYGHEVILDDRDSTPGVKFKDSDLVGIPVKVVLGERKVKEGKGEIQIRKTGERLDIPLNEIPQKVGEIVEKLKKENAGV